MKIEMLKRALLVTVLPPLLGAAGALAATVWPAYVTAFCGGPL